MSCQSEVSNKLTIACAANMRFAIEELVASFSAQTSIECQLVISSSGALTAQIMEGAPYDVFVAANMLYPERIYEAGLSETPPQVYANGELVIWTMNDEVPEINSLTGNAIRHIAIANPKLAPYGSAAVEYLKNAGIYKGVEEKLVFGESLGQTNQFIVSKAADLGITSRSSVIAPGMEDKGSWQAIDSSAYSPIAQGVVKINRKTDKSKNETATRFYEFLFSETAKAILKKNGYRVDS